MSARRPQSSKSQEIDSVGKRQFELSLAKIGWKVTPRSGDDYGLDGSVAIFYPNQGGSEYSGLDFAYQLKSTKDVKVNSEGLIACSGIKESTIRLFRESNSNPLLVVIDVKSGEIYWEFAHVAAAKIKEDALRGKTVTLKIKPNKFDDAGRKKLIELLRQINDNTLRPIELPGAAHVVLAKLDANADAAEIKDDLLDAVDNANAGHFPRAISKALGLLPRALIPKDRARILKILCKSHFELSNYAEAIKYGEMGTALDDDGLISNLAFICAKVGNLPKAWEHLNARLSTRPESAELISAKGYLLLMSGNPGEAAPCFAAAIALNPKLEDARMNEAFIFRDRGEYSRAREKLDELIKMNPTNTYAKVAYANILLMDMNRSLNKSLAKEAEMLYDAVINQYVVAPPKDQIDFESQAMALIGKSVVENDRGNLSGAQKILKSIEAGKLKWRTVYYNLAQGELGMGNTAEARKNYIKALRIRKLPGHLDSDGKIPDMWEGLAKCHLDIYGEKNERRFLNKSIWAYRIAMEQEPEGSAFVNLGITYLMDSRVVEAMALADANSLRRGSHYLRAMCFERMKDRAGMLRELLEELKSDPNGIETNFQLGNYWFDEPDWNRAIEYYEKGWNDFNAHLHLAAPRVVERLLVCYKEKQGALKALEFFGSIPDFLKVEKGVSAAITKLCS